MLEPKEQMRIICKGAHSLVNEEELFSKLTRSYEQNRPLIIKLGLDPSAPDIHLGHAVVLRKIKQMQDLGHHAVTFCMADRLLLILITAFTSHFSEMRNAASRRYADIKLVTLYIIAFHKSTY